MRLSFAPCAVRLDASVAVFMPPAVLAGEPPTIISRHIHNFPPMLRSFIFAVLKPAVRAVTDWKMATPAALGAVRLVIAVPRGSAGLGRSPTCCGAP